MAALIATNADNVPIKTVHLRLAGCVQGVGFRPHVYRIAKQLGIDGWVRNQYGEVEILASGQTGDIDLFTRRLIEEAPKISAPKIVRQQIVDTPGTSSWRSDEEKGFSIIDSIKNGGSHIHLPLDLDCCDDCLAELNDPHNRRYHYPFINCTQCGPRYTAITQLPYDRASTNMGEFPRCPHCEKEYNNPGERRFHAEAISCPECGPQLTFIENGKRLNDTHAALQKTLEALQAGKIIAIKGVGGYHLLCAANSNDAVARLRTRKARPDKPLAIMFSNLDAARHELIIDEVAAERLCDRSHPIVLCQKRAGTILSSLVAPGLNHIGALLPYSPLHHLILNDFGKPVIATSANISGEPVLTEADEVEARLSNIADAFLHHNRTITHTADDSLFQVIKQRPRPLRPGRGHAPLELSLPFTLDRPLLAVGGQMKNTIALAWDDRIVISPHIGELGSPRTAELFKQTIESLQRHYHVIAESVVCDQHPGYYSSRWAAACELPLTPVFHHHAHAAAVVGEYNIDGNCLVFTWDGTGLSALRTDGNALPPCVHSCCPAANVPHVRRGAVLPHSAGRQANSGMAIHRRHCSIMRGKKASTRHKPARLAASLMVPRHCSASSTTPHLKDRRRCYCKLSQRPVNLTGRLNMLPPCHTVSTMQKCW